MRIENKISYQFYVTRALFELRSDNFNIQQIPVDLRSPMFMKNFSLDNYLKLNIKHFQRPRPWEWRVLYAFRLLWVSRLCSLSLALSFATSIILRRHRTVPTRFLNESSFRNLGSRFLPRKEVIQPHLPVRLPCYDFTPVTTPALGRCLRMVSSRTSGVDDSHGVTGGVYKTRERIQRSVLICVY